MKEKPDAKIAVLYQNDDFGKDYLKGLKDGLGAKSSMIVAEESYETAEPSIDSHIVKLKAGGADVLISITTPKFAAQTIKKMAEIDTLVRICSGFQLSSAVFLMVWAANFGVA